MGSGLSFGISRSHAGADLDGAARRFADALSARVGRKLNVVITADYEKLLDGVLVGAVTDGDAELCAHYISDGAGAHRDDHFALAQLELRAALGDAVAGKLRVLDVTDPIPPDGMVLAEPLDGRMQAALRDALLSIHDERRGFEALKALCQAERLAPVTGDVAKIIARLRAHVPER